MITWIISDRSNGQQYKVGQPRTEAERDQLKGIIKMVSRLAMRGGCLYEIA